MQTQALSFSVIVEGRKVLAIVQNSTFLAQLILKEMRMTMNTYNHYLWMSTTLLSPLSIPFPQLPFYHMPTWELPLFNPLAQTMNPEIQPTSPFLFQQQIPEDSPVWTVPDLQVNAPYNLYMKQENALSSLDQVVPSSVTSTSQQRIQQTLNPPPLRSLNEEQTVDVEEIEDAISLLTKTRTEIGVLKDIRIMIYKKRFAKNTYSSIL